MIRKRKHEANNTTRENQLQHSSLRHSLNHYTHQPQQNPAFLKYFVGCVKAGILLMLVQILTSMEKHKPAIMAQGQQQQSWHAETSKPSTIALDPTGNQSTPSIPLPYFTSVPLQHQLKVPLTTSSWKATAILDTGSS